MSGLAQAANGFDPAERLFDPLALDHLPFGRLRFVALSAQRMAAWMASDLSRLDLLVIQIDGLHVGNDLVLVAALGIDGGEQASARPHRGATETPPSCRR
jgi:hypothetical protein